MKKVSLIWYYFSNLGLHPRLDAKEVRITRLINRFAFSLIALILFSFIIQVLTGLILNGYVLPQAFMMLPSFAPLLLVFYFNKRGKYFFARLTLILHPLINTVLWMFVATSQQANIHYSFLLFPIPIVILFRSFKIQLSLTLFVYICFILSHIIIQNAPPLLVEYSSPHFGVIAFGIWLVVSLGMLRFFVIEIESTESKLNQSNIELEEFSRLASHDMKEPLRTISSFSSLLRSKYKNELPEEANEYLNYIESGTRRLNNLLMDLSNYNLVDKSEILVEEIDLNRVVENIRQDLKKVIDETSTNIKSEVLPSVKANKSHMIQLFQNIISNGIKFQPKESSINPRINISGRIENGYCILTFQDNGIGIPKEYADSVVQKFKRLHNQNKYEELVWA